MSDFNQIFIREGATVSGKGVSPESSNCQKTGVVIPLPQRYHQENKSVSISGANFGTAMRVRSDNSDRA